MTRLIGGLLLCAVLFPGKTFSQSQLVVLGNVQDAGSPHIACTKSCCKNLFENPIPKRKVVSLGLIDKQNGRYYMFEAGPDFHLQARHLNKLAKFNHSQTPDGIFLTHAHIGHYTGLMYLGREAMNADQVPVYAMPGMKTFLEQNGPWSQLVELENIELQALQNNVPVDLSEILTVTPFLVPHRDEYSETVGYRIKGPQKTAIFIPDIDKWSKWDVSITDMIKIVDYAFLDATFFDAAEVNNRDISEIPHPFVIESMELFDSLSAKEKSKVIFIHFNHTNPLLNPESDESILIKKAGYRIARLGDIFEL
jgi:pyrroloquinoline quinone biosynthesis protein B